MNTKEERNNILILQIIVLALYAGSLILSALIAYNDTLIIKNKKQIFSNEDASKLSSYNAVFVSILYVLLVYIVYQHKEISKKQHQNLKYPNQILYAFVASALTTFIFADAIVAQEGKTSAMSDIETPGL